VHVQQPVFSIHPVNEICRLRDSFVSILLQKPCHFQGDPVMPGCLGLDALWQMVGFFLGWLGAPGKGRALGVGEVKFSGMVIPTVKKIEYVVTLKRVILRKLNLAIADGLLKADGAPIYQATDLRVGLFTPATA